MKTTVLGGFSGGRKALSCGVAAAGVFALGAALRVCADVAVVNEAPSIDGRLDDACWKELPFHDDFKEASRMRVV